MDSGKYSPLREAHQRIKMDQEVHGAKEVTDRKIEQGSREASQPEREATDRVQRSTVEEPERATSDRRFAIPEGPAPNESEAHFRWRVRETENLERDWQRERRWEAVRKGHAQPTNNHHHEKESKPTTDAEVGLEE